MSNARLVLILAWVTLSAATFGQVSGTYTDLHDFGGTIATSNGTSGLDGCFSEVGVTFDTGGNMVGVTDEGGAFGGGIVWEITASGTYRDLHDFGGTVVNADGVSGWDGNFPTGGITFDRAGNLYGTTKQGGPNELGMV
jgi:hypothetical protein